MLLALLTNVKRWVFNFFLTNHWADKEAQLYFKDKNDSNKGNKEQAKKHYAKNKIEFSYPDNRTENIELKCWNFKS